MSTYGNFTTPSLEHIGHWVLDFSTGLTGILVDIQKEVGKIIVPGEYDLRAAHCKHLDLLNHGVAWNDRGVPLRFVEWESILDIETLVPLADIPESVRREFAKQLEGCWVVEDTVFSLILDYVQSDTGDFLMVLEPCTASIKPVDIDEDLRILPDEFREWGNSTEEFRHILDEIVLQTETGNTEEHHPTLNTQIIQGDDTPDEPWGNTETNIHPDELLELIENNKIHSGLWVQDKEVPEEYILTTTDLIRLPDDLDGTEEQWVTLLDPHAGYQFTYRTCQVEPLHKYAWNNNHEPTPTPASHTIPLWAATPINLADLPEDTIKKFATEIVGCWAYYGDIPLLITKIKKDEVVTLGPRDGDIRCFNTSDSLTINPLTHRAWGRTSEGFKNIILQTLQPHVDADMPPNLSEDHATKTQEVTPPNYYQINDVDLFDIIQNLTFSGGNIVQHVIQATRTDGQIENNPAGHLEKARWYLDREITRLKNT